MTTAGIVLLFLVVITFIAMARGKMGPEIGLPALALASLILSSANAAGNALRFGFEEFAHIALIFTACAMAAHALKKAQALRWAGLAAGQFIGRAKLDLGIPVWIGVPAVSLFLTWLLAAGLHNTTSILVMAEVIAVICEKYRIRALPVLHGALAASNIGGFSTRWGDTPNIVEARVWDLTHVDFLQILWINLGCLALLIGIVAFFVRKEDATDSRVEVAAQGLAQARRQTVINLTLVGLGFVGICAVVVLPIFWQKHEISITAGGMLAMVLIGLIVVRRDRREYPFEPLGFETYATLAGVFVLAAVLGGKEMGIAGTLSEWLKLNHASVWSVACLSYLGTLFTEAASWANAASGIVFTLDPTNRAAWALGGGICAGSSSLVTAASAGILLLKQTGQNPVESRVTFASYWKFGLGFSLVMLGYYILVLNLLHPH